jgi:hypothetical protein
VSKSTGLPVGNWAAKTVRSAPVGIEVAVGAEGSPKGTGDALGARGGDLTWAKPSGKAGRLQPMGTT